jgi:predicted nucleic acid-binding protein
MCIIVDNCVAAGVFVNLSSSSDKFIHKMLATRKTFMVYDSALASEYSNNRDVLSMVLSFDRAGIAKKVPDADVAVERENMDGLPTLRSNDAHIIALARASGARVLCSADGALGADFKDKTFVDKPRGKVFKRMRDHEHLIRNGCHACF